MLRWIESRMFWGVILIAGGVLFLLQTLLGFEFGALFWAMLFGLASIGFISAFVTNREHWWALIPGFTLGSIGVIILVDAFFPRFGGNLGGFIVLGGIGAAFVAVYLANREHWWAVIPAGVLLTLAVVAGSSDIIGGSATGGIFFLGLAATFGLVGLLPTSQGRMQWAFIPAGILGFLGLVVLAAAEGLLTYALPAALILAGLFFILRTLVGRG